MSYHRIIFHLPRSWLGPFGTGAKPFYEKLAEDLRQRGIGFEQVPLDRDRLMALVSADDAFHIVNHGQFRHPRVLNAGIAYIYPYWNLDPWGIRAFSSIADQKFDQDQVDAETARAFFRRLRKRMVGGRLSRYAQPKRVAADLPRAKAAVFLQSEGHRIVGETCHLDRWQMLRTVLQTVDGPVIVKPHPRDQDENTRVRLAELAESHKQMTISEANIHDILSAAERVVTINSAVGIEAYLHRKPVILCGRADFHHIAQIATSQNALQGLLNRPVRKRAYDKYVYWYFGQQCLSATEADLTDRFLARIAGQGFQF